MKKNLLVLHFVSHRKFLLSTLHPLVPGHECRSEVSIDYGMKWKHSAVLKGVQINTCDLSLLAAPSTQRSKIYVSCAGVDADADALKI